MVYGFNNDKSKVAFNDFIVVGEELSSNLTILSSQGAKNISCSFNITKTGYIPIGVVGVGFEKIPGSASGDIITEYVQLVDWHFSSRSNNDYLYIGVRRLPNYTSDISMVVTAQVLYMKIWE